MASEATGPEKPGRLGRGRSVSADVPLAASTGHVVVPAGPLLPAGSSGRLDGGGLRLRLHHSCRAEPCGPSVALHQVPPPAPRPPDKHSCPLTHGRLLNTWKVEQAEVEEPV